MGASESPSRFSFVHRVNDSCRGTRTWSQRPCDVTNTHARGLEGQAGDKYCGLETVENSLVSDEFVMAAWKCTSYAQYIYIFFY